MRVKVFISVIAVVLGLAVGYFFFRPHTFHGTVIQSPEASFDFTLTGSNGDVSLSDYRGKLVVMYFGYTVCPDICRANIRAEGVAKIHHHEFAAIITERHISVRTGEREIERSLG